MQKIEIGDKIYCHGLTATVAEIIDQWTDYDPATKLEYYCFEGRTTDGQYRIWKQLWDGGRLIKKGEK